MKKLRVLLCIMIMGVCMLAGCQKKDDIVGDWHIVTIAGSSVKEYAKEYGMQEILINTNYTFAEDGTFVRESGLTIAADTGSESGTWKYKDHVYTVILADGTGYSAQIKDDTLTFSTAEGNVVLAKGSITIDEGASKAAYEEYLEMLAGVPGDGSEGEDPEEEPEATTEPGESEPEETEAPSESEEPEETENPDDIYPVTFSSTDVAAKMVAAKWTDADGAVYEFLENNTFSCVTADGAEIQGEYQLLDMDDESVIFDMIIDGTEQLKYITEYSEKEIICNDGTVFTAVE